MAAGQSDIEQLFSNLKIASQKKSDVTGILTELSKKLDSERDKNVQITSDIINQFVSLLQSEIKEIPGKVAEIVAVLAKQENYRGTLSDQKLVTKLCSVLNETNLKKDNFSLNVVKQICRALGNLCFENDACRKCVLENNGLKVITDVVRQTVSLGNDEKVTELRSCAVGFLLNFVAGNEDIYPAIMKSELVNLLCDVLDCGVTSKENEAAAVHCLIILGVIADSSCEPILKQRLCNTLVKVLRESSSGELVELCVELMHSQAEYTAVSLNLAKAGLCELLIQLLEKHKNLADDIDTRNLFKMACDLIIIILNDDESMELLYNKGKGDVYTNMVSWLSNTVDEIQVTGVLAIGNFARADAHCIDMVKQGISKKLLTILSKNNSDGDMKLQHALLSALRNLVIPDENKPLVIKDGLLETLYPMLSVTSFPVVFKLLGTLRIVMDKQEKIACELGCKKDLVEKLVEWSYTKDHPGVQGEASRLLAWLLKNSRNQDVMKVLKEYKAIPQLIDMILSDHEVMQNEALLALIIFSTAQLSTIDNILLDAKIGEKLTRLITEKKPKKEVLANTSTLLRQLCFSSVLKSHLRQCGISTALTTFVRANDSVAEFKDEVTQLTNLLESG